MNVFGKDPIYQGLIMRQVLSFKVTIPLVYSKQEQIKT